MDELGDLRAKAQAGEPGARDAVCVQHPCRRAPADGKGRVSVALGAAT